MDQPWSPYVDSSVSNRQPRYAPHALATPQHSQRDPNAPATAKQETFTSPTMPSRTASMALASPAGPQGRVSEYNGDGDGDVPMEDADPYNKPKYASRANHQHRHSQQFVQQEESAAARRYSPMNLSPTSPYGASPQQQSQNTYTSFTPQTQGNRQSPTRSNPYISPPQSYYSPPGKIHVRVFEVSYCAN